MTADCHSRRGRRLRARTRHRGLGRRASRTFPMALGEYVRKLPDDDKDDGHRQDRLPGELFLLLAGLVSLLLLLLLLQGRSILAWRRILGRHLGHIGSLITL